MRPAVGLVLSAFAILILGAAAGGAAPARAIPFGLEDLSAEDPLYFAGDRLEGLPLTAVLRRSDTAEYVSFVYGDCVPEGDAGCAPPVEIQVWPACRRHLALYGLAPPGPALVRTTIRGVPVALLDGGTRLELQTGRATVVVFADSPARVVRVGRALRPVGSESPSATLPHPGPGAFEGTLEC